MQLTASIPCKLNYYLHYDKLSNIFFAHIHIFNESLREWKSIYVSGRGIGHLIMIVVGIFKSNDETQRNVYHYKII